MHGGDDQVQPQRADPRSLTPGPVFLREQSGLRHQRLEGLEDLSVDVHRFMKDFVEEVAQRETAVVDAALTALRAVHSVHARATVAARRERDMRVGRVGRQHLSVPLLIFDRWPQG